MLSGQAGFGEALRGHRRTAHLTLEQLAEASGVSARALSDMERGRSKGPQQRSVAALADALALEGDARRQFVELARDGRLRDHWSRPNGLCELPRSVPDFTGRSAELVWLSQLVYAAGSPDFGVVGLITGSAGLGKTTLAVRAAHSLRPSFPDGVLFVDLFGMSQMPRPAEDALRSLLGALGVSEQQIPGDGQERASLYRSLLRDRRVLVVLDNAASEEQVRPLLPGNGASTALITTRRLLAGLEGVRRLGLGPLPLGESRELMTAILGEREHADEKLALTNLVELCGGLPLAVRIIANRLVSRPGWDAVELAARLADEERRLDQFTAGDLKVAGAFRMSYEQLPDPARRVFRRLAAVPGRSFDAALASTVGEMTLEDAWTALDALVDLGLLQDATAGRYFFHDLVRLFARERLTSEEGQAETEALTARTVSWLLRMATRAGRWFEPDHGDPGEPGTHLTLLSSSQEADWWLRANADNWLSALRLAAGTGEHGMVLQCAESMHWFSERWAHSPHWHEVFTLGARAAAALDDLEQQATQVNYLAWVQSVPPGDPTVMLLHAAEALELATRGAAIGQIAWAHQYSAVALRLLGRRDEAVTSSTRAAEIFKSTGDIDSYAQTLSSIANCLLDESRYAEALERFRHVLSLMDDPGSGMTPSIAVHSRTVILIRIGYCLGHLGRRAEAISALSEGADLMDTLQMSDFRQADALETLAALLADDGRTAESSDTYTRAARVFAAIGDTEASGRCHALATTT
ncbi:ATP-binding protein [Streptomyces sp. NPDC002574]|uniref:ATP-binding protein n=1 Tax=Streptomyces sp. NPDC002574 TaxID=3364652 RepID=UPI00368AD988